MKKNIEYNPSVNKQRKGQMAEKTKKTTAKKPVAKKAVAKNAPAKKVAAKKTPVKQVVAPVVEMHPCGCDKTCPCGGNCECKKHHCGFWKKLIVVLVFFALGFAAAKLMPCPKRAKMPKPQFDDNGCLVVKCPKMVEKMAQIDINNDGCVDKSEFKAFKREMRKPAPAPVETAAPVAE